MKRSVIRKSLTVIIVGVILLALLGLLSRGSVLKPSFRFLSGRNPVVHVRKKFLQKETLYTYSFEGDFNDVCADADADAELTSLGFVDETRPGSEPRRRLYKLRNKLPREWVTVAVLDKHKYSVYSTPAHSEYSSPDVHAFHYEEGWVSVSVSVTQVRTQLRPLYYVRYWLSRLFRGNQPLP